MTVIAWDGRTLAADKKATNSGYGETTTKIHRLKDGRLVAGCGQSDKARELIRWLNEGADPKTFPDNSIGEDGCRALILIIDKQGKMYRLERTPLLLELEDKFTAMGSGRDYALAMLYIGKTAVEAVTVASALDDDCGRGIDTLTLED